MIFSLLLRPLLALTLLFPSAVLAGEITIGTVSREAAKNIREFQPLADYLAGRLGAEGIGAGKVVIAPTLAQMAALLKEGKVDLYIDSPFPSIAVSRHAETRILARRWKKGVGEYHSVVFVRRDSGIKGIDGLKGKMLAFEEPVSSASYFLPKAALLHEGLKLTRKPERRVPVEADETGYVFSNDDRNTLAWVWKGEVAAGAINNMDYDKLAGQIGADLRIIYRTAAIPRHLVNARPGLDRQLAAKIQEILFAMEYSEEGRKVLAACGETRRFDPLPGSGLDALDKLTARVERELE